MPREAQFLATDLLDDEETVYEEWGVLRDPRVGDLFELESEAHVREEMIAVEPCPPLLA